MKKLNKLTIILKKIIMKLKKITILNNAKKSLKN